MGKLEQFKRTTSLYICAIGCAMVAFSPPLAAAPRVYKLDLSYYKIINNRDLQAQEIESKDWTTAVTFDAGIQAGRYYLEPTFHFESAFQKVTTVGLEIHHGFNINEWFAIEHFHHSQHRADNLPTNNSETAYPLQDFIGVRVHFIPDARKSYP
jgi:hypothetical protein